MSAADPNKSSCTFCRARKVKCVLRDAASQCEQCQRHAQNCIFLKHQRGRKLGSSRPKAVRLSQDPQGEGGLGQGPIRSGNGGMSWGESGLGFEISNTGEASGSASRPAAISSSSPEATWSATSVHQTLPHVVSPGWTVGQVPPVVPTVTPIHSEAAKSNQSQSPLDVLSRVCGGLKPETARRRLPQHRGDIGPEVKSADQGLLLDPISLGMCTLDNAQNLFSIFWSKLANYAAFLDERIHTVEYVQRQSSFLLSVILQTAARHAPEAMLPGAAEIARVLDRHLHFTIWPRILLDNLATVHVCQACMLWATFLPEPSPGDRNSGWTLFGHAIRIAVESGVNGTEMPSPDGFISQQLLARNNERTWFTCFVADRSWAVQTGRAPMLAEDARFRHLDSWLSNQAVVNLEDHSIVALIVLRKIMAQSSSRASATLSIAALEEWRTTWLSDIYSRSLRMGQLGQLYYHYANIVMRLQWLCKQDDGGQPHERAIVDHASSTLNFAAYQMPADAYWFAHNNAFTMLSFAAANLYQFKEFISPLIEDGITAQLLTVSNRLKHSVEACPHKHGVNRWHAEFFEELHSRWNAAEPPAGLGDNFLQMLLATFPQDVVDTLSWRTGTDERSRPLQL